MNDNESLRENIEKLMATVESLTRRIDQLESDARKRETKPESEATSPLSASQLPIPEALLETPPAIPVSPVHIKANNLLKDFSDDSATPELSPLSPIPPPLTESHATLSSNSESSFPSETRQSSDSPDNSIPRQLPEFLTTPSVPAPKPAAENPTYINAPKQNHKPKQNWELKVASYWFPRIGAVALVIGIALFAREHLKFMNNPYTKVLGSYLFAFVLIAIGLFKDKKFPIWSQPIAATGLALTYFTTYAMMFVKPMHIIDSLGLELALLAINLAAIFGVAHYKRAETIGGMALVLGYITAGMIGNDRAALYSNIALSCIAVLFLVLNRWVISTAAACIGTYLTHLYVWKYLSPDTAPTALVAFRHHSIFLSMYFSVFTIAGLLGAQRLKNESIPESKLTTFPKTLTDVLALLVQSNNAIYFGSMLYLFRKTGIHWDQFWMFLFGFSALCFTLSLVVRAIPIIQCIYIFSGTVAFTGGLIIKSTPHWLPIFTGLQAIAMLLLSRKRYHTLWACLSTAVMVCALTYGMKDLVLALDRISVPRLPFKTLLPHGSWVPCCLPVLAIAWIITFVKQLPKQTSDKLFPLPYIIGALSVIMVTFSLGTVIIKEELVIILSIITAVGSAFAVTFRIPAIAIIPMVSGINLALYSLVNAGENRLIPRTTLILLAGGMLVASILHEIRSCGKKVLDNIIAILGYVTLQILLYTYLNKISLTIYQPIISAAIAFAIPIIAIQIRSKALLYSGFVSVISAVWFIGGFDNKAYNPILTTVCLLISAALISSGGIYINTKKSRERLAPCNTTILEIFHFIITFMPLWAILHFTYTNRTPFEGIACLTGYVALLHLAFTVFGFYNSISANYAVLILILFTLTPALLENTVASKHPALQIIWGVLSGFFIIAVERFTHYRYILCRLKEHFDKLITQTQAKILCSVLVCASIGTILLSVLDYPHQSAFMFTTAIVTLGFLYVVLGFTFKDDFYRKSGFIMLCIGILKAALWDVSKLDNPLYKIVSWITLGILIISASFLYNRFADKSSKSDES